MMDLHPLTCVQLRWYPYELLVAGSREGIRPKLLLCASKSPTLIGMSEPLCRGVDNIKFGLTRSKRSAGTSELEALTADRCQRWMVWTSCVEINVSYSFNYMKFFILTHAASASVVSFAVTVSHWRSVVHLQVSNMWSSIWRLVCNATITLPYSCCAIVTMNIAVMWSSGRVQLCSMKWNHVAQNHNHNHNRNHKMICRAPPTLRTEVHHSHLWR